MSLSSFKLIPRASLPAAANTHWTPSYVVWVDAGELSRWRHISELEDSPSSWRESLITLPGRGWEGWGRLKETEQRSGGGDAHSCAGGRAAQGPGAWRGASQGQESKLSPIGSEKMLTVLEQGLGQMPQRLEKGGWSGGPWSHPEERCQ